MTPSIEQSTIIYIVSTASFLEAIEAGISNKHFVSCPREWSYIHSYFDKYRTTPTIAAFVEKFPDYSHFSWDPKNYDFTKLRRELNEKLLDRQVLSLLNESVETFQTDGANPALDMISNRVREIQMAHGRDTDIDLAKDFEFRLEDQERRQVLRKSGSMIGISTGIKSLDYLTGGWEGGMLPLILGKTGIGKSFLSLLFAFRAWEQKKPVLYINLEMSPIQVAYRFDTFAHKISNTSLFVGKVDLEQYTKILESNVNTTPFILCGQRYGGSFTPARVDAKIKRYEPKFVLIDYVTLMKAERRHEKRHEEMDDVCRNLKTLAEVYQIPIIIVAQTHRPAADKRALDLEDIAVSYAMVQHADTVLTANRGQDETVLKLKLRKIRTGSSLGGIIRLAYNVDVGDMHELTPEGEILKI